MKSFTAGDRASAFATSLLVACALIVTGLFVRRELFGRQNVPPARFARQEDWRKYDEGGHLLGPVDAPVRLIEFADFQCPACRALEARLRATRNRFPGELAIRYRHFPLNIHRHARAAAEASECAARQGRFDKMHELLFQYSDSLGISVWRDFALRASVPDLNAFDRCMRDSVTLADVSQDRAAAEKLGAMGTPTVLLNGVRFSGSIPQSQLDSLVAAAIRGKIKQ